jgi:hypothetical protein
MEEIQMASGAPRPTKMGNIVSPWHYDNHAEEAIRTTAMRAGRRRYGYIWA